MLFVPGLVVALLLGLRGIWLLAMSAPISVSMIAVAALAAPVIGVPWSVLPVLILTAIAALAAFAWTRWVSRPARQTLASKAQRRRSAWPLVLGIAIPALTIGFVLLRSMLAPDYVSQRYDNVFHLNAVQYIIDTGNASPLWVGTMTSGDTGGLPFYPTAWHALVAVVAGLSGSSVVVANNAAIIAVAAIVWPMSAVLLQQDHAGARPPHDHRGRCPRGSIPRIPLSASALRRALPPFLGLAASRPRSPPLRSRFAPDGARDAWTPSSWWCSPSRVSRSRIPARCSASLP